MREDSSARTIASMKLLLMLLLGLGVGGAIYYFVLQQQDGVAGQVNTAQESAQEKADAYKKQQAEMMLQLGQ